MEKKSKLLLIIGIIALMIGGYLFYSNDGGDVNQQNVEIATNATNAQEAARQIAANNRGEVGGHMAAMFLSGVGGVLVVASVLTMKKKKTV